MSDNWIQSAHIKKGAFTRKAKAHKMSVREYASDVKSGKVKASGTTEKQASLAQTFEKLAGRGK